MITHFFKRRRLSDEVTSEPNQQPVDIEETSGNLPGKSIHRTDLIILIIIIVIWLVIINNNDNCVSRHIWNPNWSQFGWWLPQRLPNECKKKEHNIFDIALAVKSKMSDADRLKFLTDVYKPPANYVFRPVSQAKRKIYIQIGRYIILLPKFFVVT